MSGARSAMELSPFGRLFPSERAPRADKPTGRIVDMHVHFDEKNPGFFDDLLKLANRMNLTTCLLTPFAHRRVVAEAAKQHPRQIVPFGFVDLDAPDVVPQVEELHSLGFRGLGELEFVKKPYNDPSLLSCVRAGESLWLACPFSHRHRAAKKFRRARGRSIGPNATDPLGGDCAALSENHPGRCPLWQSRV